MTSLPAVASILTLIAGCSAPRASTPIAGTLPSSPPTVVAVGATANPGAIASLPTLQPWFEATNTAATATSEAASATASAALGTAIAAAKAAVPISCRLYDPDPLHLWNRLYCLFYVRIEPDGKRYGPDELDFLHWMDTRHLIDSPSYDQAVSLLDEFLTTHGERLIADPVRRAVLQRDLWAAFDWLDLGIRSGSENGQPYDLERRQQLQSRIANVMHRIALSRRQIADLPDNYAGAVRSGVFVPKLGAGGSPPPFLPTNLFQPNSPWLILGGHKSPLANFHINTAIGGRSVWLILMRVPEARRNTAAFVASLAAPGSLDHPPELIAGTEVALVRRMLLVDDQGMVEPSPLTESIQMRHYATPATESQVFVEIKLDRKRLFDGLAGGLLGVGPSGETFIYLNPGAEDPFESASIWPNGFHGAVVLDECHNCHFSPGTRSIQSFSHDVFPDFSSPLPARIVSTVSAESALMASWKMRQPEWESLRSRWHLADVTSPVHGVVMLTEFSGGPGEVGYIHVLDGESLVPLARIRAHDPATRIKPVPGGRRVLVAQASVDGGYGPTLFVLDLADLSMCRIEEPGDSFAPSADGRRAYNQQGTTPIDVFDLAGPGSPVAVIDTGDISFQLHPSPDGRWLVGAEYDAPVIKLFDVATFRELGRSPTASDAGAWLGDTFYALGKETGQRVLFRLTPPSLTAAAPLHLKKAGVPIPADAEVAMLSAGANLVLYARINPWEMFSSRDDMPRDTPGGLFLLHPTGTTPARHLAADTDIADLAASPDGRRLYALLAMDGNAPRLEALDVATGAITGVRPLGELGSGSWTVAAAELTVPLPAGDVRPRECPYAEATPFPTLVEPTALAGH